MIRVAIDTSTRVGSVAVGRRAAVLSEVELGEQTRHASRALPALDEALTAAGVSRGEIQAVVVGAGPGSFTGVRVAGATAKGLTTALGVPLLAYSSLLSLAVEGTRSSAGEGSLAGAGSSAGEGPAEVPPVCALLDARRGEVYAGCWRIGGGALLEVVAPWVGTVEDLVEKLAGELAGAGLSGVRFVGDGAGRYREALGAACADGGLDGAILDPGLRPRAASLLWLAHHHPALGEVADATGWEPAYVRGSSAERGIQG